MAHQINTQASSSKLDIFTLSMMRDVIKDHAITVGTPEHTGGYCCQLVGEYQEKVAAHETVITARKAEQKTNPEGAFRPITVPQTQYIQKLRRRCPEHLISPEFRGLLNKVLKHEEIPADQASLLIEAMKAVVTEPGERKDDIERYVTASQVGYLKVLLAGRTHTENVDVTKLELLPFKVGSEMIDRLVKAPYKGDSDKAKADKYIPEEGAYQVDGEIYQVVTGQESGSRYAKRFDSETEKFVYVGQEPFKLLTKETWMTAEQAKDFAKKYVTCCKCGIKLVKASSKERGYGPICASKMGWPL